MYKSKLDKLKEITNDLENQLEGLDYSSTFGCVFIREFAEKLLEKSLKLNYTDAIHIASLAGVDVQEMVETDEEVRAVSRLADIYATALINSVNEMYDDDTIDVQLMKNIVPSFTITL